jgi:acetyl esterase/lipase
MKLIYVSVLLLSLWQVTYSQVTDSAKIKGVILSPVGNTIKIGDETLSLAENGSFIFTAKSNLPGFIDINYGNLNWSVYLEPFRIIEFETKPGDLSGLIYKGDLKAENDYLIKASQLNSETNEFFNKNWVKIHSLTEKQFISTLDSIKQLFLIPLASLHNDISDSFVKLFKADVEFSFSSLKLQYPGNHYRYTDEKKFLSSECNNYLNSILIDDIKLIDLQSYKRFCKAWIDYNADMLADKISNNKNYTLKKMDVLFEYIPTIFKDRVLTDYWLSEYLTEHVQNTWLPNSEKYIKEFNRTCKTEAYKSKINDLYNSYQDSDKNHTVKIFKSINGFQLEANIFYPGEIIKGDKRPAMVIIHGGGFVLGNPSWAFEKARHYAGMGMIAIAAQYRLSNFKDVTPVDAIQDVKDLMFWLRKNADSLKIKDNKIAASGWSVGAQLCATLAIFPDTLTNSKISSSPDALLLTSPGTGTGGWFTELLNGEKTNPADYSPVDHVKPGLPPTIILQGRDDTVTPLEGVQLFHDMLIANGNYCEFWIYNNVGHLFTPTSLGDNGWPKPDPEVQKQADLKADDFLRKFEFIK